MESEKISIRKHYRRQAMKNERSSRIATEKLAGPERNLPALDHLWAGIF
jgi:hypothetical protein